MVEIPMIEYLKESFNKYACEEKIKLFPNQGFSNYEIETEFGYTIIFYYEYIDDLYNIKIKYPRNILILTSYEFYKKFVKTNIKKGLFKKHTLKEHFDILLKFIDKYNNNIKNCDEFVKEISITKKGYENIFI